MHAAVRFTLAAAVLFLAPVAQAQELSCPKEQADWSPQQVFEYRMAAIQRGDLNAVACTYADDAVVIMPGTVIKGRAKIMANFAGFAQLFGGVTPTTTSVTAIDNILMVTFFLHAPMLSIPDGSDTYVFNNRGQIVQQTVHDTVVFNQP